MALAPARTLPACFVLCELGIATVPLGSWPRCLLLPVMGALQTALSCTPSFPPGWCLPLHSLTPSSLFYTIKIAVTLEHLPCSRHPARCFTRNLPFEMVLCVGGLGARAACEATSGFGVPSPSRCSQSSMLPPLGGTEVITPPTALSVSSYS